jgi:6-phosphogluconolactonase
MWTCILTMAPIADTSLGNTLVVLRPLGDGRLTELQTLSTLPDDFDQFSHTAHLDVSRDGRHLYVSNRGHDSIMVSDVGADGLVAARRWVPSGGRWPWFFTLTADDTMLVANNLSDDDVAVFDVDAAGDLHLTNHLSVPRPAFVATWPWRDRRWEA